MFVHLGFGGQALFLEFEKALQVVYFPGEVVVFIDPFFVNADFALDGLCAFGIIPELGVKGLGSKVFYFAQSVIDVKDTSSVPPTFLLTP